MPLFLVSMEKHVMTPPVIGVTGFFLGYKGLSVNIQGTKTVYKLSIVPVVAQQRVKPMPSTF